MTVAGAAVPVRSGGAWQAAAIVGAATAALLPELTQGLAASDSFRFDVVWAEQFGALFAAGDPYPRWLPLAWDGLGAPTFYHYPPLFFWVAALVRLALPAAAGTMTVVALASLAILAASGWAMRAWLVRVAPRSPALPGAIGYMLAPYHLYDLYGRGALAEASGYALLPVAMIAIERLGRGRGRAVALLGLSYGLLILAHLPTALLAGLTLLPAYALFRAWRCGPPIAIGAGAAAGGLLGLALAALYLVPAVLLIRYILAPALFGPWYDPANWSFLAPRRWPSDGRVLIVAAFALAALLLPLAALALDRRVELRFWAALATVLFALVAGLVPYFWSLPLLAQVQFPARLLPMAEFAAATAVTIAWARLRGPVALAAFGVAGLASMLSLLIVVNRADRPAAEARRDYLTAISAYRDAPEYLPAGAAIPPGWPPDPARAALPAGGWLARGDGARVDVRLSAGTMRIAVAATAPTRIVARRFFHPRWRVTDGLGRAVAIAPTGERLVSWIAPAGRSDFTLGRGAAPGERASLAISAVAALVLAGLALWRRSSSRTAL